MEKADENYTRIHLIELLARNFGKAINENGSYKFIGISNQQIAEALAMSASQFTTLVNPSKAEKEPSYRLMIKKVLIYEKAEASERYMKERDEYKKKQKRYSLLAIVLLFLLITSLIFLARVSFKTPRNIQKVNTPLRTGIYVEPPPSFEDILEYHRMVTTGYIKLNAVLIKYDINNHKGDFTRQDSIDYITRIRTELSKVLENKRGKIASLNFKFSTGELVIDSLLNNYPSIASQMFHCSEEEILDSKILDSLCKDRTVFDEGVFRSKLYYFNKKLTPKEVGERIEGVIQLAATKQQKVLLPE